MLTLLYASTWPLNCIFSISGTENWSFRSDCSKVIPKNYTDYRPGYRPYSGISDLFWKAFYSWVLHKHRRDYSRDRSPLLVLFPVLFLRRSNECPVWYFKRSWQDLALHSSSGRFLLSHWHPFGITFRLQARYVTSGFVAGTIYRSHMSCASTAIPYILALWRLDRTGPRR